MSMPEDARDCLDYWIVPSMVDAEIGTRPGEPTPGKQLSQATRSLPGEDGNVWVFTVAVHEPARGSD